MRGQFVLTVAASVVLASSAFAAQSTAKKSSGTTSNATSSVKAPSSAISGPGATTAPTGAAAAAQSTGQSQTTLEAVVPAKTSPWGFTLTLRGDAGDSSFDKGTPEVLGVNRFTVKYKLNDTQSIQARQQILYNYPNALRAGNAIVSDPYVGFLDTKLATLGDWNLTYEGRLYAGLGEKSRFVTKQLGAIYNNVVIGRDFGKLNVSYWIVGAYDLNTQDGYTALEKNEAGAEVLKQKANEHYWFDHYLEVAYPITPMVSIAHDIGFNNVTKRSVAGNSVNPAGVAVDRMNALYNETYVTVTPMKQVSLIGSVANSAVLQSNNDFELYKSDEVTYRAIMSISL